MSNVYPPTTDPVYSGDDQSATDVAKDQAAQVKDTATSATKHVGGVAKDEAANVVSEAKTQAKDLLSQTRGELTEQASAGQQKVATGLRSVSDELRTMASKSESNGVASDLVGQVADRAGSVAGWLEGRDPGSVLTDVKNFARRKPGTFIAIAAVAGVLAGRLTSSVVATAKDEHEQTSTPDASTTTPAAPLVSPTPSFDETVAGYDTGYTTPTRVQTDAQGSTGSSWDDSLDVASVRGTATGDDR